jgi:hypothetical protein
MDYRCVKRKRIKAKSRASEAETEGIQHPGNAGTLKQGETSAENLMR